ncbi:hypothetical protein ACHRVK_12370 [Flavobacterium plurextorum]|uniref:hypothetical protein n=1 Tax=Flavobacterium plurextorum TaxID=1114867 RepID=UPI003756901B
MKLINPRQDFEIILENILSSEILNNSNQKMLLLILLCNHKKFNKRHYSFTLSDELCSVLNVSNPTFRKERDKLELLNLIFIKVEVNGKMKVAEKTQRKHSNLYYYFNWQRLHELGFIKMEKGLKDIFNIGDIMNLEKVSKLNDELHYNFACYNLERKVRGNGKREVLSGKDIKVRLRIMANNLKHGTPIDYEYAYYGLHKVGQNFIFN